MLRSGVAALGSISNSPSLESLPWCWLPRLSASIWPSAGGMAGILFIHAIVGVALVAGGASASNQYLERDQDGRMHRTRDRPLPSGRIGDIDALVFAVAISLAGITYLLLFTNIITGILAAVTLLL